MAPVFLSLICHPTMKDQEENVKRIYGYQMDFR